MIIDQYVLVKLCSSNYTYWKDKGYQVFLVGGRAAKNGTHDLLVRVSDLKPNSNARVRCLCMRCNKVYTNRYSRVKAICSDCIAILKMRNNDFGKANKGKEGLKGQNHPRWNPNKPAFKAYANKVRWLTEKVYEENINIINPDRLPRTLCGTEGGYQLDHKVSIKFGFENGIEAEVIAQIDNLQMLPWKHNRSKGALNNKELAQ